MRNQSAAPVARDSGTAVSTGIGRILYPDAPKRIVNCWQCGSHFAQSEAREMHCYICLGWRDAGRFLRLLQGMQK